MCYNQHRKGYNIRGDGVMSLYDRIDKLIEEDYLNEMAVRVGNPQPEYLIYVNANDEGYIPHFHYVDVTTRGKDKKGFHTCIRIDKAEYFKHGNKIDSLNSMQKRQLQSFLKEPFEKPNFQGTNWDYIVMIWNTNNSQMNVDEDQPMPDYMNLK